MDYNNNYDPNIPPENRYDPRRTDNLIHNPGQNMATASMILGLVSVFTVFTVYLPLICGGTAFVLAILSKGYGKKMLATAKIGIGGAIGGVVLVLSVFTSVMALLLSGGDALVDLGRQMDQRFERQTGQQLEDFLGESYEDIMKDYAEILGN